MAGTWARDQNLVMHRMTVENEVLIRGVRIDAHHCGFERATSGGQKAAQQFAHGLCFAIIDFAADGIGVGGLALVMDSDFDAISQVWKPIEKLIRRVLPKINRTIPRLEEFRMGARLEPIEDLALDAERKV